MAVVVMIGEVRRAFDELAQLLESREEVANWANMLMHGLDNGSVRFEPEADAVRIKRALIFLSAVDMRDADGTWFHTAAECLKAQEELEG